MLEILTLEVTLPLWGVGILWTGASFGAAFLAYICYAATRRKS